MRTSKQGIIELIGHEGIGLSKYKDSVGVWTIGVGATASEIPDIASWPMDRELSLEGAFNLLESSITKYEDAINKALKVPVKQYQFDALSSICYNIGVGGLSKSTFMKLINVEALEKAIFTAIMAWNKPKEIIERRSKEAKLYTTGQYSNNNKALLFPVSEKGTPMYSKAKTIDLTYLL